MSNETPGQQRIGRVADLRHRALLGALLADALAREKRERNAVEVYAYLDGRILHDLHGELARPTGAARNAWRATGRRRTSGGGSRTG